MNEINWELLVQIVVNAVSFIGVVLGIVIAWKENKQLKYIETVTEQTIQNMLFLRRNASSFLVLLKPEVIASYKDAGKDYVSVLMEAAVNIESIMKYCFDMEREIMNIVRQATKQCLCYYKSPSKELECKIRELDKQFYNLMTVYDYSDWKYIKSQATNRPYQDFPEFEDIYYEQLEKFAQAEKPCDW